MKTPPQPDLYCTLARPQRILVDALTSATLGLLAVAQTRGKEARRDLAIHLARELAAGALIRSQVEDQHPESTRQARTPPATPDAHLVRFWACREADGGTDFQRADAAASREHTPELSVTLLADSDRGFLIQSLRDLAQAIEEHPDLLAPPAPEEGTG